MAEHAAEHAHPSYEKIWGILVVLLIISVLGPMLEIRVITFITAFGIATVKAYLVAKYFMHVDVEPKFVIYILVTMIALMLVFVGGVAPDVLSHSGQNWENTAAQEAVERGLEESENSEDSHH